MRALTSADYHKHLSTRDLATAENFLLVSYRLWLLKQNSVSKVPDWRMGFEAMRLMSTAEHIFAPLLDAIQIGVRRPLEIQQPGCRRISRDEGLFLEALSQCQHLRITEADVILESWLRPTAARVASSLSVRLAAQLENAGLVLPLRSRGAAYREPSIPAMAMHSQGTRQLH